MGITNDSERIRRETELARYYDGEAPDRSARRVPAKRVARRTAYLDLLRREGRRSLLELGCGPGRDGRVFADSGLAYAGVDLAPQSVARARSLGLDVRVGSVGALPFDAASFAAGWTMSTLLHIADEELSDALAEIARVLVAGAPLAIGAWGSRSGYEGPVPDRSGSGPDRFFSIRTDGRLRDLLGRIGSIEEFSTWPGEHDWHYQWVLLRTTQSPV